MKAKIKYTHKISPRRDGTDDYGPYEINLEDLATVESAMKWLRKNKAIDLRKKHARKTPEGGWVFFPGSRSVWHAISIVPER